MLKYRYIKAAVSEILLALVATGPTMLTAETLRVLRGDICAAIEIPINRTISVQSTPEYAEISIANPGIADISSLSTQLLLLSGEGLGRTTLTLFDSVGQTIGIVEIITTPEEPDYIATGTILTPELPPVEIISVPEGLKTVTLTIPSNVAIILTTDLPFADIEKSNRDVVDAATLSETDVYILGKAMGKATITLVRNNGQPATVIQLTVVPNMDDSTGAICLNAGNTS